MCRFCCFIFNFDTKYSRTGNVGVESQRARHTIYSGANQIGAVRARAVVVQRGVGANVRTVRAGGRRTTEQARRSATKYSDVWNETARGGSQVPAELV